MQDEPRVHETCLCELRSSAGLGVSSATENQPSPRAPQSTHRFPLGLSYPGALTEGRRRASATPPARGKPWPRRSHWSEGRAGGERQQLWGGGCGGGAPKPPGRSCCFQEEGTPWKTACAHVCTGLCACVCLHAHVCVVHAASCTTCLHVSAYVCLSEHTLCACVSVCAGHAYVYVCICVTYDGWSGRACLCELVCGHICVSV